MQLLNSLGYGKVADLPLHLVYNPSERSCPGRKPRWRPISSASSFRTFGIVFNKLYAITNLPIGRFAAYLRHSNKLEEYMQLLTDNFNPATIDGLMCRNTISVGWRGQVYDCDFNQQLDMQWENGKRFYSVGRRSVKIDNREIMTGDHCFGCTAGAGSSCGGAIV
jgi:radical SAM/Cys-rich protein